MTRHVIIFLGTDGSGKSTLCDRLLTQLPEPRSYVYFGLREPHLDFVRRYYQLKGDMALWARLFLFPLDYFLRRRALPREGNLVLDRLPGWAIISPNPIIRGLYRLILPRCDTLILCTGDAHKIVARKPERSLEGCIKDIGKWQQVFETWPAIKKVSLNTTDSDIDACLRQAVDAVLSGR